MVVLDTCTLLWWTLAPDKLSSEAARKIDSCDDVYISSISIWEIGIKIKRGKLVIPISLNRYIDCLKETGNLTIIPVDELIWLKNIDLDWDRRDPADRTIVATAILRDLPLITADTAIIDYYDKAIW